MVNNGAVVLDVPSRYQAIYGNADDPAYAGDRGLPKGRLTLLALDKQGIEFRWTAAGCYRRDKAPSLNAQNLFWRRPAGSPQSTISTHAGCCGHLSGARRHTAHRQRVHQADSVCSRPRAAQRRRSRHSQDLYLPDVSQRIASPARLFVNQARAAGAPTAHSAESHAA